MPQENVNMPRLRKLQPSLRTRLNPRGQVTTYTLKKERPSYNLSNLPLYQRGILALIGAGWLGGNYLLESHFLNTNNFTYNAQRNIATLYHCVFLALIVIAFFKFPRNSQPQGELDLAYIRVPRVKFKTNEIIPLHFHQEWKGTEALPSACHLAIRLTCYEQATQRVGSYDNTQEHILWQSKAVGTTIPAGSTNVEAHLQLSIPAHIPRMKRRGFGWKHEGIHWLVEVYQKFQSVNAHHSFAVEIS